MLLRLVDRHAAGELGLLTTTLRPLGPLLLQLRHGCILHSKLILARRKQGNEAEARKSEHDYEYDGYGLIELIYESSADCENFRHEEYYINSSRFLLKWENLLVLENSHSQATVTCLACE